MTTIFLQNNLTLLLDVWSDLFSIVFHQSPYLTHILTGEAPKGYKNKKYYTEQ